MKLTLDQLQLVVTEAVRTSATTGETARLLLRAIMDGVWEAVSDTDEAEDIYVDLSLETEHYRDEGH